MTFDSVPSSQSNDQKYYEDHWEEIRIEHPIVVPKRCSVKRCFLLVHFSHHSQGWCCTKHRDFHCWCEKNMKHWAATAGNFGFHVAEECHRDVSVVQTPGTQSYICWLSSKNDLSFENTHDLHHYRFKSLRRIRRRFAEMLLLPSIHHAVNVCRKESNRSFAEEPTADRVRRWPLSC